MENAGMWRQLALFILAIGFVSGCVRINDDLGQVFRYKHPKIGARKKVMRSIAGSFSFRVLERVHSGQATLHD